MAHNVPFVVTELGMQINPFELHLPAAFAEEERRKISERTRVALRAAKARGTRLGMSARPKGQVRALAKLGGAATREAAIARLMPLKRRIKAALSDGASLRAAAGLLNEDRISSPNGGRWHAPTLLIAARQLGLR
jgi:DNA invertase Pin-like site-specific DNA recombinase